MIAAENYHLLYLSVVTALTLWQMVAYWRKSSVAVTAGGRNMLITDGLAMWALIAVFTLFIGLRPLSDVFPDMNDHAGNYIIATRSAFTLSVNNKHFLFNILTGLIARLGVDFHIYFVVIAGLFFAMLGWAMRKMFGRDALFAFIIYLGAFSTFAYTTNCVRAGLGAVAFLVALSYYDSNRLISLTMVAMSVMLHHAMQLPAVAYVICSLLPARRAYMYIWFGCCLLSVLQWGAPRNLFAQLTDSHGALYLAAPMPHTFRLDFVIYGFTPIIIGWWAQWRTGFKSATYTFLFNLYVLTNAVWLLCMDSPFTDRIAYLSWLMLPVIAIYPFLKLDLKLHNQYRWLCGIAGTYMVFTAMFSAVRPLLKSVFGNG